MLILTFYVLPHGLSGKRTVVFVCCLFLSIIFLLLARANKSRKKTWVKAFRLKATVTRIRYSESRPSRDIIDDDKSSTEVTLGFSCLGQDYEKIREYKGILKAPSRPGIRLPILFDPATKNWCLSREARPFWILHLILAAAIACFIFLSPYVSVPFSIRSSGALNMFWAPLSRWKHDVPG